MRSTKTTRGDELKIFKAEEFRLKPARVYLAAFSGVHTGEKVIIKHGSYEEYDFEIKAVRLDGVKK